MTRVGTLEAFCKYTDEETFNKIQYVDTVSKIWEMCLENYKGIKAIYDDGNEYTYEQIEEDASFIRGLINEKVTKKTGRIGIYCANSYSFVKTYIAVVTNGYTAVILPPQLDAGTVYGCSMMFALDALIYLPSMEENLSVAKSQNPNLTLLSTEDKGSVKGEIVNVTGDDDCAIIFTGGTTGRSKGALLTHRAVCFGTVNGCLGYKDVFFQRYILVLPFSHVFGLIRNLMTSLYTGSSLLICRNNKDMFKDCAMFKPTILVMVPALAEMALNLSKKFGKNMLGDSLKVIIAGAAAVPPYLIEEYGKLGITMLQGYGLTESANLVSGNPHSDTKPASVGLLYPEMEAKLSNGELLLKGPNMLKCYVGCDEDPFEDGYFKTGDLAKFDEDGSLYITGRIKEIIVLPTGENISPAEVERYFDDLDIIQDCQVFEAINDNGNHILAIEVYPREVVLNKLGVEDKKAYVEEEVAKVIKTLPSTMIISKIIIRDTDFARTPAMKIIRYKLEQ